MVTAAKQLGAKSLPEFLRGRKRQEGCLYKSDEDESIFIDSPATADYVVDEAKMVVGPVTISTPSVDRVGDILVPQGIVTTDYARNPVILWDHGFSGEVGGSMPIASAADHDGNLSIEISEDAVTSMSYFHGKTLLSDQVFSLVAARAIKAASVRPTPIISSLIAHDAADGDQIGVLMEAWSISEWSWVAIGCNQDALFKSLRDGRINGKKLATEIQKSFSHLDVKPAKGIGMKFKKLKTFKSSDDEEDLKNNPDDEDVKTGEDDEDSKSDDDTDDAKTGDEEEPAKRKKKSDESDDDAKDEPTDDEEMKDDEPEEGEETRYGAQVLSAIHASMKELSDNIEAAVKPLENEAIKTQVEEMADALKEGIAEVEGLYQEQYGKSLVPSEEETKEEPQEQEEALKSFLSKGASNRHRWGGYASRLKTIVGAKNLTASQKKLLRETVSGMSRVEKEAKRHVNSNLETKLAKLEKTFSGIQKAIGESTPYRRG